MAVTLALLFLKVLTGCLLILSAVKCTEYTRRSHHLFTSFKAVTNGKNIPQPEEVLQFVIGRTTQLIFHGKNIPSDTQLALTDQCNMPGILCTNPIVQLTTNPITNSDELNAYLSAPNTFYLQDSTTVCVCTRQSSPEGVNTSAVGPPGAKNWVHEGEWTQMKVVRLKDRSPSIPHRLRRSVLIDDNAIHNPNPPVGVEDPSVSFFSTVSPSYSPTESRSFPSTDSPPASMREDTGLRTSARAPSESEKNGAPGEYMNKWLNSINVMGNDIVKIKLSKRNVNNHRLKSDIIDESNKNVDRTTALESFTNGETLIPNEGYLANGEDENLSELAKPYSLTLDKPDPSSDSLDKSSNKTVVRVYGMRVESHAKGLDYSEASTAGVISLQSGYEAKLSLFGEGLSEGLFMQFTAISGNFGDPCDVSTSEVFKVETASEFWASVKVTLPLMAANQDRWYLCLRKSMEVPAIHQGNEDWLGIITYTLVLPLWVQVIILIVLLILSGLFSGLNLGLMALDKTELEIVSNTGKQNEREYAKAIAPVRRHGNFLLCTLLLGNVLVNSTLTILLDELSTGLIAIIGSTSGIVIFGEIVPQAICSRHGLRVGANTVWLVRIFMVITGVVAWPISKILDLVLGEEIGNTYDRERLKELIRVTQGRHDIRQEEQNIICGALELSKKTVSEVMTRLDDAYMLSLDTELDFNSISEIMQQGYSRIPIYDGERTNIVSVLLIKDLAFIDPDDNTPLRTLSQFYQNPCSFVFHDTTLDVMFKDFKGGNKGHMAFVQKVNSEGDCDPFYEVLGLVTLEDIIEELIQEEIVDETDVIMDNRTRRRRKNHKRKDFKEFSQGNTHHSHNRKVQISPQMQVAALQFLRTSVDPFKEGNLSEGILKRMLTQDIIHVLKPLSKDIEPDTSHNFIYIQGKQADFFILILEGHVEVTIGRENMTFDSGPFTFFGLSALNLPTSGLGESPSSSVQLNRGSIQSLDSSKTTFTPDYSVKVVTEVTFVKIRRQHYIAARRAYLVQLSQRDPQAEDNFEKEMAKILKDESLTSPVWENSAVSESAQTDCLLNGKAIRTRSHDESFELTISEGGSMKRNSLRTSNTKSKGENLSTPGSPTGGNDRGRGGSLGSCDDLTSLTSNLKDEG